MTIIIFLIGLFIGAGLAYHFWYSPKATIKKLWKEVFEITKKKKDFEDIPSAIISDKFDSMIFKRKKMINALLDYYFDPEESEEDEEYIKDNRP